MKEVRRLKITSIKRRIVRCQPLAVRANCPVCAREVNTLDTAQAAIVLDVSPTQFQLMLADATVHALPTVSGSLRICQDSLFQSRSSTSRGATP
ncbi:MAG: hypothetical protein ABI977_26180 [Acidobacteriota bacterium]